MPKPFLLGIEVEEIALGSVLRTLHLMPGVRKVNLNLDQIGKPPAADAFNQDRANYQQAVVALLMKHGPMKSAAIGDELGNRARAFGALNSLKKKHVVARLGGGRWQLSSKASAELAAARNGHQLLALPAPARIKKTASGRVTPGQGPRAVFAAIAGKAIKRADLLTKLATSGMTQKSVDGVLSRAARDGLIKRHDGMVTLTAKGIKQQAEAVHG